MKEAIEIKINGQSVFANEKEFSTGSKGYHASGKVFLDDKKYQCNFMLIEVGSKPTAVNDKKKK